MQIDIFLSAHLLANDSVALQYELKRTSKSGHQCGICHWNKFCTGCSFTDEDIPHLLAAETLAIEFEPHALALFNAQSNYIDHESVALEEKGKESPIHLEDCLRWFAEEESLDDKESWYCPNCKEFRPATKKMDIWKLPKVLIVQLKRFQYRGRFVKINKLVEFPLSDFDLSEHVLSPNDEVEPFHLFAVLNHFGGLKGGHYTTYATNKKDNQWYCFNDSRVVECDRDKVVTPAAYVLFYGTESLSEYQVSEPDNQVEDRERNHHVPHCPLM